MTRNNAEYREGVFQYGGIVLSLLALAWFVLVVVL